MKTPSVVGNDFFKNFENLTSSKIAIIKEFIDNNDFLLLKFDPTTFKADRLTALPGYSKTLALC
jgi:hypothetical protein